MPTDGPLLHAQRRVTLGKLRVIEVAVFAQSFDDLFNNRPGGAAPFQQTFAQLGDRARLCSQQLSGARKDAFAGLGGIETRLFLRCFVASCLPRVCLPLRTLW